MKSKRPTAPFETKVKLEEASVFRSGGAFVLLEKLCWANERFKIERRRRGGVLWRVKCMRRPTLCRTNTSKETKDLDGTFSRLPRLRISSPGNEESKSNHGGI